MSEPSKVVTAIGTAKIAGRVERQFQNNGKFYTDILIPAATGFDKPEVVQVRSSQPLGALGTLTEVLVKLGGYYRKAFDTKPDAFGQVRRVQPVEVTLDAV